MLSNLQTTLIHSIAHFSTVLMLNNYRHKLTTIYILQVKTITCSPLNPPLISSTSDLKWRMWIQKRDNRRRWGEAESSCVPRRHRGWGWTWAGSEHMPKSEEAASQPQPRRHSPTARSSQRHAPSADTARASQERRGRGKRREGGREGRGQGQSQQTGIR